MTVLLAIDPGPTQSAWLVLDGGTVVDFDYWENDRVLALVRLAMGKTFIGHPAVLLYPDSVVIEKVEGFGMPVGAEVFETVFWSGRFAEAASPIRVDRIGRKAIKVHLCGSLRAKDPNIRQALLDRYGGAAAKGTKAKPGPLYGISGDLWAALAVAVTWADRLNGDRGAA